MSADEFVTCINCGREVPKTQYCIYCGHNMVRLKDRPKQIWNEGKISENSSPFKYISKQETEKSVWPVYEQPPEYRRFKQMKEEKDSEINYLIKESLKYWKKYRIFWIYQC